MSKITNHRTKPIRELVREINSFKNHDAMPVHGKRLVPNIFIAGTECVGKSTLFNLLLGVQRAEVSDVPVEPNIVVNGIWANTLRFVDGVTYNGNYSDFGTSIRDADIFVQVCDIQSLRGLDFKLTKALKDSNKPFIVVLNKIDRILSQEKRTIVKTTFEKQINGTVLLVSALTGEKIEELVFSIWELLNKKEQIEFLETLAQQGQMLRREKTDTQGKLECNKIIQNYVRQVAKSSTGKAYDLAEIIFLHSDMIREIAKVYNVDTPPEVIESLIIHIIRSTIHALSQNIPLVGDRISVASAIVWTMSIGNTTINFFEQPKQEHTKHIAKDTSKK